MSNSPRNDQWHVVKFGDIVHNINERILPEAAEGLPYVGLEHLDPESLEIRRWGMPDEVEAQKLRFYKGDIIFGKRRYYQKKLAVADFDGICSAHAMVLRAKPDVVLPEFLPFFMQSEIFFERAMSISVGSLSPTINWSTLAKQEFSLPPKDEQCRIAEILWAAEETLRAAINVAMKTKNLLVKTCQEWTAGPIGQSSTQRWVKVPISECAEILDNFRVPLSQSERAGMKGSIPYYGANGPIDYIDDFVYDEEIVLIGEDGDHFLKYNDWEQSYLVRGKCWVNNHAHVMRAKPNYCSNAWLHRYFQYRNIWPFLQDSASMTRRKLTQATLVVIPVRMPISQDEQEHILRTISELETANNQAKGHIEKCHVMQKTILDYFLRSSNV